MYRNLIVTLLGVTSAVFTVQIAGAADQVTAPPAAGFNWSGVYVGFGAGFGAVRFSGQDMSGFGGDGLFGELTVGYDHMITDRILLGGFIDIHAGNIGPRYKLGPIELNVINNYGFDAAARLGYVLNGSTLGYVLGGYSWQHFKLESGGLGIEASDGLSGYVLGVGMETVVSNNWTIKTEYRYSNYDSDTGNKGPGDSLGMDASTHTFHIGANYRFGARNGGAAVASPAYDWTGFYIGAALGAGETLYDTSIGGIFGIDGFGGQGAFGELSVGYDHDFGNFVAGVMIDGKFSGISTNGTAGLFVPAEFKQDYGFDILGRVGMKVNPSTLAYMLGGYSWGHFKIKESGTTVYDWSSSGFSVGGGLETAVATNTTLGIEYRYSRFADEDLNSGGFFKLQPSSQTVRVGLKYKLN